MKVQITYVDGHIGSETQASQSLDSFNKHNWSATLNQGITPETINENDFTSKIISNSRLVGWEKEKSRKFLVKKSCLFNNLKFCERVIEGNEPMVFAEHDAVCIKDYEPFDFDEFCFLSLEYAFQPPTALATRALRNWKPPSVNGVHDFPNNYPLLYYKKNIWKDSFMTPGTAAYALSPKGAQKILVAVQTHGLDQSDFIINSYNIRLQYLYPSPVRYNSKNLNLSHRL